MPPTLETTAPAPVPAKTALVPDLKVIDASAGSLIKRGSEIQPITDRDGYQRLDKLIGEIAAARKGVAEYIQAFFSKHIATAHKAHKDLCDDRTKYLEENDRPLAEILTKAMALMRTFEQAEAKREADEKAAADKLLKEQQEAATKKAEEDRQEQLRKDEEDRINKAAQAEANGDTATAERILNAAPPPPPPPKPVAPILSSYIPSGLPLKSSHAGTRKNWTWKIAGEDQRAALTALVKAAHDNPDAYLDFLTFDDKALKERAKSKEAQARVPGIEFFNDAINVAKAGRA